MGNGLASTSPEEERVGSEVLGRFDGWLWALARENASGQFDSFRATVGLARVASLLKAVHAAFNEALLALPDPETHEAVQHDPRVPNRRELEAALKLRNHEAHRFEEPTRAPSQPLTAEQFWVAVATMRDTVKALHTVSRAANVFVKVKLHPQAVEELTAAERRALPATFEVPCRLDPILEKELELLRLDPLPGQDLSDWNSARTHLIERHGEGIMKIVCVQWWRLMFEAAFSGFRSKDGQPLLPGAENSATTPFAWPKDTGPLRDAVTVHCLEPVIALLKRECEPPKPLADALVAAAKVAIMVQVGFFKAAATYKLEWLRRALFPAAMKDDPICLLVEHIRAARDPELWEPSTLDWDKLSSDPDARHLAARILALQAKAHELARSCVSADESFWKLNAVFLIEQEAEALVARPTWSQSADSYADLVIQELCTGIGKSMAAEWGPDVLEEMLSAPSAEHIEVLAGRKQRNEKKRQRKERRERGRNCDR